MQKGQSDTIDAKQAIEEAVDFLNEALVRLDAVMEHQAAALIDHAINILAGWTCDSAVEGDGFSLSHTEQVYTPDP